MYYIILATDAPGMAVQRQQIRPSHREYLRHPGRHPVTVHLGGPTLTMDGAEMNGTLLVVEAADLEAVNEFIFDDPYARAGLFSTVVVRPWAWSLGAPVDRPAVEAAP
jgi:uncharacterized protein YciI